MSVYGNSRCNFVQIIARIVKLKSINVHFKRLHKDVIVLLHRYILLCYYTLSMPIMSHTLTQSLGAIADTTTEGATDLHQLSIIYVFVLLETAGRDSSNESC
jgi:hypothetical protein